MDNLSISASWTNQEWDKFSEWLRGMLQVTDVTVTFTKKDGTERIMKCTLQPESLPKVEVTEDKKARKVNQDTIAVFDVEAKAWRSFTLKSVNKVQLSVG